MNELGENVDNPVEEETLMDGTLDKETPMIPVSSTSVNHVLSSAKQNNSDLSDCESISSQSCCTTAKSAKKCGPSARGSTKRSLDTTLTSQQKEKNVTCSPSDFSKKKKVILYR